MELRSTNVQRIWKETVLCVIGEDLGINKQKFEENKSNIKSMLSQIKTEDGYVYCCGCHIRTDGEQWTPYIQIIEMLLRMGKKIGCVKYVGALKEHTLIKIIS